MTKLGAAKLACRVLAIIWLAHGFEEGLAYLMQYSGRAPLYWGAATAYPLLLFAVLWIGADRIGRRLILGADGPLTARDFHGLAIATLGFSILIGLVPLAVRLGGAEAMMRNDPILSTPGIPNPFMRGNVISNRVELAATILIGVLFLFGARWLLNRIHPVAPTAKPPEADMP